MYAVCDDILVYIYSNILNIIYKIEMLKHV